MLSSGRYRPNAPRVIGEVIDDEAILIDLETGSYFSLVGSGAQIWSAIERGATAQAVLEALAQRHADLPPDVAEVVGAFLAQLVDQELAVVVEAPAETDGRAGEAVVSSAGPADFEPPRLDRFDDMQELILLDPIHEVDEEQGWPAAKAATPSPE